MLNPEYTKSAEKPEKVVASRDGFYYYNYDIQELTDDTINKYSYLSVEVEGEPSYKKCSKAVIEMFYEPSQEFDYINTIIKAILTNDAESKATAEAEYDSYRNKVAEIKSKVKEDFAD